MLDGTGNWQQSVSTLAGVSTHQTQTYSALNALLGVQRNARSVGASLRVVNPSPFVAQLLTTLGVAEALGYRPSGA